MKGLGRLGAVFLLVLAAATLTAYWTPVTVNPRRIFFFAMIAFAAYVAIDYLWRSGRAGGGSMIDRRRFMAAIACAVAVGTAHPLLAQSDDGDWVNFDRLARAFNALLNAPNPIADTVTRLKFVDFLRDVKRPVNRIRSAKREVLEMLQPPSCSSHPDSASRMAAAAQAARRIVPLVSQLATHLDTLHDAIRPQGISNNVRAIAEGLRSMQSRKMWVNRVSSYCGRTPNQRTDFRQEVADSHNRVLIVAIQLDSLIDRLS